MQSHPTLSNQLVGLFDQVNRQADEYVELFNALRRKIREMDELRHDMDKQLSNFRVESNEATQTARQAIEIALEELHSRVNFVHEVHADLESIRRLKTALVDLRMTFQKKNMELDEVVHSVQNFVRNEVETSFVTQDKNIDRKLKAILTELSSFDTRLVNIQDLHRREFMQISEEVAKVKSRIADTKYLVDDATKAIEEIVASSTETVSEKTKKLSDELGAKVHSTVQNLVNEGAFKDRVDHLRVEVHAMDRKLRRDQQSTAMRSLIGIGVAGLALLLAIVSFFVQ